MEAKVIKTKHYKRGKSLWVGDIVMVVTPFDNENTVVKVFKKDFEHEIYSISRKNLELLTDN